MTSKIGQLTQEVAAQNTWWRDSNWHTKDPDLQQARTSGLTYRATALDDLTAGCLYVLRGPRRAGKTVAVKQLVQALLKDGTPPTAIVRVAVDGWTAKDLRTLTQNAALPNVPAGQARYWLLDEITSVSGDWATQIKWLRDNDPGFREATIVLTGSNAAALTLASGQLAGRRGAAPNLDRTLLPMGFRAFVAQLIEENGPNKAPLPLTEVHSPQARAAYESLIPWLDDLVRLWEQYLQYGGFPVAGAAARAGKAVPPGFVEDIFNIIANDALKSSHMPAAKVVALLERVWLTMSSFANLSSIGADIDVSHEVVGRHISYLRDSYLLWQCPQKDNAAWVAKERAQGKLYAVDPLVARLAHLRNAARQDIDLTVLTEMQLGNAIRRRVISENTQDFGDYFLFHVRTPTRKEIDFVSEYLGSIAIEGKYTEGAWRSEAATVEASRWTGVLATRNVLDMSDEGGPWAVPAAFLSYLIDT